MQVDFGHVTLRFLCKLLLAAVVIAATVPGLVHARSVSPAVNATLLVGQVMSGSSGSSLRLWRLAHLFLCCCS